MEDKGEVKGYLRTQVGTNKQKEGKKKERGKRDKGGGRIKHIL